MDSNFYLDFENKFRGKQEDLIKKLSIYDSLIELIIINNDSPKFIDIGCGRGEWLRKWKKKVANIVGIENDSNMINSCRDNDVNIIKGDAIRSLNKLSDKSVDLITIFHLIEHLDNSRLFELMKECYRVLSDKGVLLMETPSIDNLIISTNTFYLDSTHINHINTDSLIFNLEKIGFNYVKNYFINSGPLHDSNPLKITRILNGISQDVAFIAVKTKNFSDIIFSSPSPSWELDLEQGMTTLQAAIEYDLESDRLINEISILKQEIKKNREIYKEFINLKNKLRFFIYIVNILNKFLNLIIKILLYIKKKILYIFNTLFDFLAKYAFMRRIFFSKTFLRIINLILKYIFLNKITVSKGQIENKINKILNLSNESKRFNKMLLMYHNNSFRSQEYSKILNRRRKNK